MCKQNVEYIYCSKFTPTHIILKSKQWSDYATEIRSMRKAELQPALISADSVESEEMCKFDTQQ